ncbi:MAG: hypothetical protein WCP07_03465 [bacterium]
MVNSQFALLLAYQTDPRTLHQLQDVDDFLQGFSGNVGNHDKLCEVVVQFSNP